MTPTLPELPANWQKDVLAAQLYIAAKDDDSAVLTEASAERIIDTLDAITSVLAAYAAGLAADGWISVEDRLPPEDEPVLALNEAGTIGVYAHHRDHDGWCWSQQKWCWNLGDPDGCEWDEDYEITHWQPLPAQPAASLMGGGEKP